MYRFVRSRIPLVLALWIVVAAPAISKANAGAGVRDVKSADVRG